MPHSTLRGRGRKKKPGRWTETDCLLAVALQVFEDSLHSCGHPVDWAFNEDSEGYFEVREDVCQACRARELHRQSGEGRDREPGTVESVVNLMRPGEHLRPMPPTGAGAPR